LRDATHFSDQRVGPTIVDSVIGESSSLLSAAWPGFEVSSQLPLPAGFTGDDFFVRSNLSLLLFAPCPERRRCPQNIHTTLMLVLRCEESSCLVINPHLFTEPRNTAYGTNSVMGTVVPGDTFSFYVNQ